MEHYNYRVECIGDHSVSVMAKNEHEAIEITKLVFGWEAHTVIAEYQPEAPQSGVRRKA
jgi:hypothetical protein